MRKISHLTLLLLCVVLLPAWYVGARQLAGPDQSGQFSRESASATVVVYVRTSRGTQLLRPATVRLYVRGGSYDQSMVTQKEGQAVFYATPLGNCTVEVSAAGYMQASENILVQLAGNQMSYVINLWPVSGSATDPYEPLTPTTPIPETTYNLERELDAAVKAMRSNNLEVARKRLQKAAKQVSGHPEPQYLLGMLFLQLNDYPKAKASLEKAISLSPAHARAYAALGEISMRQGHYGEAVRPLGRALDLDPNVWQSHAQLAVALYHEKQFEQARLHAERALELSKQDSAEVRLLLAETLIALNENQAACLHLDAFLRKWPQDPRAILVRTLLETTATGRATGNQTGLGTVPLIRGPEPELHGGAWAPPDVDEATPPVTADVPCTLMGVMESAGLRARALVDTLQRITAREKVEQAVLDRTGVVKVSEAREYNYLVTIRHHPQSLLMVSEDRDGGFSPKAFASGMTATGLPVMALIFHPFYASTYEMRCDGLTQWQGQPAWVVYFRQRSDRPNSFFGYETPIGDADVKLKGRALVSTNTGDVLRMETDLVAPIPAIELARSHLVTQYKPQTLASSSDPLWLPVQAELFTEVRGRRSRIRHTFQDFRLFSVTTEQKISAPKPATPPQQN
ncbi:MAG TPA: tetratricopeptide repeat protein [Acidobacteriota bacterium]|nr:tetratricopeptide repeat protein [Acidobacteriota bacterium]